VGKDAKDEADRTIDARGCVVMPGLVNAHTHVPMTLFRGYAEGLSYDTWMKKIQQAETRLTPADVRSGAYLGALEMIKSGTTAFADMYIFEDEVARVVEETGLRAALGYGMIEGLNEDADAKLRNRGIRETVEWRRRRKDNRNIRAAFCRFMLKRVPGKSEGAG